MIVSMKNKIDSVKFHEDYTLKDWRKDLPVMESLMKFVPIDERKSLEDAIIDTINNKTHTTKERKEIVGSLFSPYLNLENLKKIKKWDLLKMGVKMNIHKLKS